MLGGSPEHAQRQPFLSLTSACPQGAALSSAPRPQVGFAGRRCPRYARGQAREPIPGSHTPAAGFQLALSVTELHWSLTASRVGRGTWGMWFSSSRHAQAPRDLWVTLFLLSVPWKPKSPPPPKGGNNGWWTAGLICPSLVRRRASPWWAANRPAAAHLTALSGNTSVLNIQSPSTGFRALVTAV